LSLDSSILKYFFDSKSDDGITVVVAVAINVSIVFFEGINSVLIIDTLPNSYLIPVTTLTYPGIVVPTVCVWLYVLIIL
jgi:hypothetical protein